MGALDDAVRELECGSVVTLNILRQILLFTLAELKLQFNRDFNITGRRRQEKGRRKEEER